MKVTVNVPDKEIRKLFRKLFRIPKEEFDKVLADKEFREKLSGDLLECWRLMNDEAEGPNGDAYEGVQEAYADVMDRLGYKPRM